MADVFSFPGGRKKALTFGFDDGEQHDRRLADMLRHHGLKGTFFLITDQFGLEVPFFRYGKQTVVKRVLKSELPETYQGLEIATHTASHAAPLGKLDSAVGASMKLLSELSGMPVTGMAYPGGDYTEEHIAQLYDLGVVYARTTQYSHSFELPQRLLEWAPTCRYCDEQMSSLIDDFLKPSDTPQLFYIMGHSYELEQDDPHASWEYMENICQQLGGREDVWYATNGEIAEYLLRTAKAVRK